LIFRYGIDGAAKRQAAMLRLWAPQDGPEKGGTEQHVEPAFQHSKRGDWNEDRGSMAHP